MQPDLRSDETKYLDAQIAKAVERERERCARIADKRTAEDQERFRSETDWRQPYALNRVLRASMDIAAAIRKSD